MKLKHWIAVIIFVVAAILSGVYIHSREHGKKVLVEQTYPEKVLMFYYKSLNERTSTLREDCFLPKGKFNTDKLVDFSNGKDARLTSHMMRNLKYINVSDIEKLPCDKSIVLKKKSGQIETWPIKKTALYEVTYNSGYYDLHNSDDIYCQRGNSDYMDNGNANFKNSKEKVWLVRLDDGSWKIAKIEPIYSSSK